MQMWFITKRNYYVQCSCRSIEFVEEFKREGRCGRVRRRLIKFQIRKVKITFKGKYKFLKDFEWDNIPMFVVLTGKNGTGKTQLLDLISLSINGHTLDSKIYISKAFYRKEHLIYLKGEWQLNNLDAFGLGHIQNQRQALYLDYTNHINRYRNNPTLLNSSSTGTAYTDLQYTSKEDLFDKIFFKQLPFLRYDLPQEEFLKLLPDKYVLDLREQVTNNSIGKIFFNYRLNYIEAKANGISEQEFYSKYTEKPWLIINSIFKDIDLPFELNNPEQNSIKDYYIPKLINTYTKDVIPFSDLSSGEKVLVSLVFWLFNSEEYGVFPRLLLLDEPDAHLHPSMTKQFIDVVKNILSDKYGVRVIMTTHSPSTVALAQEESLFVIDGSKIETITKDKALKVLTSGIPSFSVNYENRRQIFVESPNDVIYYEKIYRKLSNYLIPEISLSFISSGDSRTDKNGIKISNCEQVRNITTILRSAGNNFVWGIIDWDGKNESTDFIKVLGSGNRYTIENYLFDPILISALLLREKIISRDDLGLNNNENYTDFKGFSQAQLQNISNFLIKKLSDKVNPQEHTQSQVKLVNGKQIEIPNWFLYYNGHALEEIIVIIFPQLNSMKKQKEEALKIEIIDKIIDDIPELISEDLLDVFRNLQVF